MVSVLLRVKVVSGCLVVGVVELVGGEVDLGVVEVVEVGNFGVCEALEGREVGMVFVIEELVVF